MQAMERQVALAAQLLQRAAEELREVHAQRPTGEGATKPESLPFTKSAIAVVT
jgi:hypothetical protein